MAQTVFKSIKDNVAATLKNAVAVTDTAIVVNTGQGAQFPAAPFYCSCDYEVMLATSVIGDTITVTRGVDGTTAVGHNLGSILDLRSNAGLWLDAYSAINALELGTNPAGAASIASGLTANALNLAAIPDGLITTIKIADAAITSQKMASGIITKENHLINGGLEIWQRGVGPFTTSAIGPDGWSLAVNGTDTISVVKDTANADINSGACAAITYTKGTGNFVQHFRSLLLKNNETPYLMGRTVSFSLRVKCSTPNAVRISLDNFYSSTDHVTYSNYHSGSGLYETLTVTVTVDPTAVYIMPGVTFSASTTAYVDNGMLALSNVSIDYAPIPTVDDFARCLRYYQRWNGNSGVLATGQCISASSGLVLIPLLAQMGGAPTFTTSGVANLALTNSAGTGIGAVSFSASVLLGTTLAILVTLSTGLVAGNITQLVVSTGGWIAAEWIP